MASKYPSVIRTSAGASSDSPGLALYPSARMAEALALFPNGRLSVAPAAVTPGNARTRRTASLVKRPNASASAYRALGNATAPVSTPLVENPGLTSSTFLKLANRSPAPINNRNAHPTWVTTSTRRSDWAPRPLVAVRPSSLNTPSTLADSVAASGMSPSTRPIAAAAARTSPRPHLAECPGHAEAPAG